MNRVVGVVALAVIAGCGSAHPTTIAPPRTTTTLDWTGTCYRRDIKLGHDRQGRLYASRYLNPPMTDTGVTA